jgi:hypothetical protein
MLSLDFEAKTLAENSQASFNTGLFPAPGPAGFAYGDSSDRKRIALFAGLHPIQDQSIKFIDPMMQIWHITIFKSVTIKGTWHETGGFARKTGSCG